MNKAAILKVADAIEQQELKDVGFNMCDYYSKHYHEDRSERHCQSTACIAGWTMLVMNPDIKWDGFSIHSVAQDILGLNGDEANLLFCMRGSQYAMDDINPETAVAVLRHLAENGEVQWDYYIAALQPGAERSYDYV